MAEVSKTPSLSEQYLLKDKEDKPVDLKPVESKEEEKTAPVVSEEVVAEKVEEAAVAAAEEKTQEAPAATEESTDSSSEDAPAAAAAEESSETAAEDNSAEEAAEETQEIKLETAPADYRFPTTNQTRHCFTRYIEYHKCVAAKGEGAQECDKFAKYYRSLCPSEWVERWNEQRANGTFPGPL